MPDAYENQLFRVNRQHELERPEESTYSNSFSSMALNRHDPSSTGSEILSIGLIGPDVERRQALAGALAGFRGAEVREFSSYPPALDDVPRLLERCYDVILIDLDSDREYALELVEDICARDAATVMVYSANADQELVFRCMRAGAREFLFPPFDQSTVVDALNRATSAARPGSRPMKKTRGRLLVFLGSKGGSGVTTIACNLAIAVGQESSQSTLLIDLGLPMGDAALNLGIVTEYSTDNAFMEVERLDGAFLSKLLAKHRSGISVLAAPSKVPKVQPSSEAIDKLIRAARQQFENVVVDVGSRLDLMGTALFKDASTIFLVTQAGISELRNSNRVISEFFNQGNAKLEIVINRYEARTPGLTDEHISKALNKPVQWKVPDDYASARQMQNSATPQTLADSSITRLFRQMARSVCGLPPIQEKTTGFRFRGLGRNLTDKISGAEELPTAPGEAPAIAWSAPEPICYGTRLTGTQLDATASVPGTYTYTPAAGYLLPVGTHTLWVTFTPVDGTGGTPVQTSVSITVTKVSPAIDWPTPSAISCGAALGSDQLNATASVPGTFVYTPCAGEVLPTGRHTLAVTFTPDDAANYATAEMTVPVTVAKAAPVITWPAPAPIPCGTALSDRQLNATASVPGIFVYASSAGELLKAGRHTLSVTFTPTDITGFTTAHATVELTVTQAKPTIAWPAPATISYGSRLSSSQLNATASVPGTFAYKPGEGAMLAVGNHTPLVTFTPSDLASYSTAQATVSLSVTPAAPTLTWEEPKPISEGAPLSAEQLNAVASVPGSFRYSPGAGAALSAGVHELSVLFTPMDKLNYTPVRAAVSIQVTKPAPIAILWQIPSAISYGTPLGSDELNAVASVPGSFVYAPGAGVVLTPGKHELTASFTPADIVKSAPAQAKVVLVVESLPEIDLLLTSAQAQVAAPSADNAASPASAGPLESARDLPRRIGEPETRIYKGAIYEKGEDGQWHLQQR